MADRCRRVDGPVLYVWVPECIRCIPRYHLRLAVVQHFHAQRHRPDYYTRTFLSHVSPSNISWIGSVQLFLMYAPAVLVGSAFDSGFFHHVQITGSILLVVSIFMLSLVQQDQYYQVFLAQALGIGLGVGLLFLPSLSIVAQHFRRRRPLATGVVVSGASCGGIVFPILLNHLFANPKTSFANGVRVSGGLIAGLLLVANCIMRTRLPPKTRRAVSIRDGMLHIAGDGAYVWSIAGAFCTNLGLFVPFFYLQLFAADHHVAPEVTTYILAILNAGSTVGRILPMALANKLSVYNMLLCAILASAVLLFSLFGATSTGGVISVAALFGFSSGAYVSLIPPLLGALCTDLSELGLRMGLAFSLVGTSMLVGTPIFGALLDTGRTLVWWRAIVFAGVRILGRRCPCPRGARPEPCAVSLSVVFYAADVGYLTSPASRSASWPASLAWRSRGCSICDD
ncbi:MFS general substrate transporter [Trametes cingulata]|nr:MFS general substrate transporter [Trametes cingulata]